MQYSLREKELIDNLFKFFKAIEMKNSEEEKRNENIETAKQAHIFLEASLKLDNLINYEISIEDIQNTFKITQQMALNLYKNISEDQQQKLLEYKRKQVINNYIEKNNYYRQYIGLPNIGEEPIKVSDGRYVTELSDKEILFTFFNEIEQLIKNNPDKKYLKFIGPRAIDLLYLRKCKNFSVIYYDSSIFQEEDTQRILNFYYENLDYVKRVILSESFSYYDYYNNFIMILLALMTMQKFINYQLEAGIKREFVDEESMRDMFNSYGLTYWERLPLKYKRRIIKNINKLFMYKGTNKVIIDVIKLFGFEDIEIFKHYLVKDIDPFSGNQKLEFVGVPVNSKNIISDINKSVLVENYDKVTYGDPFWGGSEPDEVKKTLMEKEFNYLSTKYISINIMYDITKVTYESAYFLNYITKLQQNNQLDFYIYNSNIKPNNAPIKLFDAIIGMYYLLCRKMNLVDNIIYSPTAIASIYGFNFDNDVEILRSHLKENNLDSKNKLVRDLNLPPGLMTKKQILDIYFDASNFKNDLEKAMIKTENIKTFKTLKEVYNCNMYSKTYEEIFKKPDGTCYDTYFNYLKDSDSSFADFLEGNVKNKANLIKALNEIIYTIESNLDATGCSNLFSNINLLNNSALRQYLISLINFFKSYTVEIKSLNLFFVFDDKVFDRIKLLYEIIIQKDKNFSMNLLESIFDELVIQGKLKFKEGKIKLEDFISLIVTLYSKEKIDIQSLIAFVYKRKDIFKHIELFESLLTKIIFHKKDTINLVTEINYDKTIKEKENLNLVSLIDFFLINIKEICNLNLYDEFLEIIFMNKKDQIKIIEEIEKNKKIILKHQIKLKDSTHIQSNMFLTKNLNFLDFYKINKNNILNSKINLKDETDLISSYNFNDISNFKEKFLIQNFQNRFINLNIYDLFKIYKKLSLQEQTNFKELVYKTIKINLKEKVNIKDNYQIKFKIDSLIKLIKLEEHKTIKYIHLNDKIKLKENFII